MLQDKIICHTNVLRTVLEEKRIWMIMFVARPFEQCYTVMRDSDVGKK